MMIIAKCATPEHLATTSCNLARAIWKHGGVVRNVKILSDRLLSHNLVFYPNNLKQMMVNMLSLEDTHKSCLMDHQLLWKKLRNNQ